MLIKSSRRPIKSRFYAVDNEGNVICEGGDYLYVETKLRDILSDDEIEKREIEIINDEIESSRRPVKSGYSDVEKALNELEDYFDIGADGDTIYTHISHDDENHIAKVCEEHNVDFSVGSNHVTLYPIESSRSAIKSSFVIEHWDPLLPQTQYVGYNDEGLAGVYDINDALQFNTKEEAKQFIKEHDEEYGGKLKIHEYPSYVQNSRRPIKSGRRQEVSNKDFINKLKSMKSKGWSTSVVGYYENDLDTDEQRLYVSGGEYTFTNNDDERRKLSRQIMALNGGEGIGYKKGNFEDVINSSRRAIKSSDDNFPKEVYYAVINGVKMCYSTDYDKVAKIVRELRNEVGGKVDGPYTETDPDEIREVMTVEKAIAKGKEFADSLSNSHKAIKSSRRPVESSFIVGKQDNGNKVYFCEDGLYYSENDYARPSIKIFDNKREADKIAKRSKSGFVSPLEK